MWLGGWPGLGTLQAAGPPHAQEPLPRLDGSRALVFERETETESRRPRRAQRWPSFAPARPPTDRPSRSPPPTTTNGFSCPYPFVVPPTDRPSLTIGVARRGRQLPPVAAALWAVLESPALKSAELSL